ncbi:hypothetical protein D9757_010549 [Collybiopsis confluens]|uniref:Uncharacterized protein n=1 Tax=Collybiopsis confluens TaxID=2823264 RepID=A0A8H5LX25_9AGAR|nr:hypothetical protein D9757_010549 [Collybiopsis confluens]
MQNMLVVDFFVINYERNMLSQAPGMVAKSAGNATVLIDNATFVEQAVQPLEIIQFLLGSDQKEITHISGVTHCAISSHHDSYHSRHAVFQPSFDFEYRNRADL